jgi:CheY-like chemotaxis protein
LRELNYRVLETHDAESALALLDRDNVRVDLLLADLVLPGINGCQLAEQLKARQPEARMIEAASTSMAGFLERKRDFVAIAR